METTLKKTNLKKLFLSTVAGFAMIAGAQAADINQNTGSTGNNNTLGANIAVGNISGNFAGQSIDSGGAKSIVAGFSNGYKITALPNVNVNQTTMNNGSHATVGLNGAGALSGLAATQSISTQGAMSAVSVSQYK